VAWNSPWEVWISNNDIAFIDIRKDQPQIRAAESVPGDMCAPVKKRNLPIMRTIPASEDDFSGPRPRNISACENLDRRAMHVSELTDEELAALDAAEIPAEATRYDHEMI
jgi:hypothetical protein